jgi:hypothetical protein
MLRATNEPAEGKRLWMAATGPGRLIWRSGQFLYIILKPECRM